MVRAILWRGQSLRESPPDGRFPCFTATSIRTSKRPGSGTEFVYEIEPGERPSEAVYSVVAAVSDRPPLELDPLAHAIDPDALDRLFGQPSSRPDDLRAEFECCGYRIVVTAETVRIYEDAEE